MSNRTWAHLFDCFQPELMNRRKHWLQAMLRRLEKRILVDLPTADARAKMFQAHLPPMVIDGVVQLKADIEPTELAALSEGYSGSDIRLVCKEAAMRPLRKVFRCRLICILID